MTNCPNTDTPCPCAEVCDARGCLSLDPPLIGGAPRVCPATGGQCGIGCTPLMQCPRIATTLLASAPAPAGYPDDNPKTVHGVQKTPMHLIPPPALEAEANVFGLGAKKYGPYNWREHQVSASVYQAAALRHLMAWWERQDTDPESGQSHLAHARACLGIVLDAERHGKLNDDRPVQPAQREDAR